MHYVQERSFIASLTSTAPGFEGVLDSVEHSTHEGTLRKNAWLTVSEASTVEAQQRFWFGYFDGENPGYRVRAVEFFDGQAHYEAWDLSRGNNVGYYLTRKDPLLWRIWANGNKFGVPKCGAQEGVTIAAVGSVPIGLRNRKPWENRYVEAGAPNKLIMCLGVEHVSVPLFDGFNKLVHIQRR
jgi:hypothetical protein